MVKFDRWYYRLGLIRPSNILSPRVVAGNTLFYPINSEVFYFKVTDSAESVSRNIPIFNKPKSVFVISYSEYGQDCVGHFRKLPFNQPQYLKQLSLKEKEFRFLKPHEYTTIKIKKDTLLIRNFSPVNYHYRYPNNKFVKQWKFINTFNTVVENINKNPNTDPKNIRYKFLTIELPNFLPKFEQLNVFASKLTLQRLNAIPSYKYFTLLELWKFLTPELKEESIFNKIAPEERQYVNLIFTVKGGCSIVNMGILENLVKEYHIEVGPGNNSIGNLDSFTSFLSSLNDDSDLATYDKYSQGNENIRLLGKATYKSKIFRKMFLLYLNGIINASNVEELPGEDVLEKNEIEIFKDAVKKHEAIKTVEEASDEEQEDVTPVSKLNESDTDKVLDKMLANDVPNYTSKTNGDDLLGSKNAEKENNDSTMVEEEDVIDYEQESDTLQTVITQGLDNRDYGDLDAVMNAKLEDPRIKLRKQLNNLKDNGVLSSKQEKELLETLNDQDSHKSPYEELGDSKISELLNIDNDSEVDELKEYTVADNKTVIDKGFNKKTIEGFDKQYIPRTMKKDAVRTVYSIQNAGMIVKNYYVERSDNILDKNERHVIEIKPLNGQPSTVSIILPKVEEDGTFKMSGNTYRMRKQRVERPIRKINPLSVVLASYYGKIFVNKAVIKSQNYGYWLFNQIRKNENIFGLILGESDLKDDNYPKLYSYISRFVRSFRYEDVYFYFNPDEFVTDFLKTMYNKFGYVYVGHKFKLEKDNSMTVLDSVVMDKDGMLYLVKGKDGVLDINSKKDYKHMLDVIGVEDHNDGPIEHATVKLGKSRVPVVIPLSYYIGLENLLKILKVKYEVFDTTSGRVKFDSPLPMYKVRFRDKVIYIERDYGKADIVLGGLTFIKELPEISFGSFNSKESFGLVFANLDLPVLQITEVKLLEDMFVDPMTRTLLRQLKEPETFTGLLIRASELLANDQYPSQGDIEGQVIKGYERINGMMYKALINSIRDHECRISFTKSKLVCDPYSVLSKIKDDSTTVLLDDLNPIAETKQKEDVSYLGEGGQKAISMTAERRATDPSVIGIMSEAHKDNSQVGITTYLTPDPNIKNVRGIVKKEDVKDKSWGGILSTPALLAPFSTHDDSKRLNFVSIMSAHVVPVQDMRPPIVRTGYESVLPTRVSDKFCVSAMEDGVVNKVTKSYVEVTYKSSNKSTKYPLKSWTTKEEAGACYTHRQVPNLKEGEKFSKDDTIVYDELFFEPDIFNRKRVIYKQGTTTRVALCENMEQWEDSGSISTKLAERLGTTVTKVISIVLTVNDTVMNVTPLGSFVNPQDVLFSFMDNEAYKQGKMDPKLAAILKDMKTSSPKAKVKGVVSNICVYYNCDLSEVKSKALRDLIQESDSRLIVNKGYPGQVNSTYSINGKPLMPNEIEIKYYIEVTEGMSIGDKAILGNQLKFTIGDIYSEVKTAETGEEIDAFFSYIAICKRITMSPLLLGTTQSLMKTLQRQMVDKYFKK